MRFAILRAVVDTCVAIRQLVVCVCVGGGGVLSDKDAAAVMGQRVAASMSNND